MIIVSSCNKKEMGWKDDPLGIVKTVGIWIYKLTQQITNIEN